VDLRTFIVELAKALGWPVAVIIILLLSRGHLRALVALVQRVKWRDFEASFGQKLENAETKAIAARFPAAPLPAGGLDPRARQILELVDYSPRAAIIEAWVVVERAIERLLANRKLPAAKLPELLEKETLLSSGDATKLIDDLRDLRNKVVNAPDRVGPTAQQAREYVRLSELLVQVLEQLASSPPANAGS